MYTWNVHVGHITRLHTLRPLPQIWLISYQHGWVIFALANSQNCLHRGMQDMKIVPNGLPRCIETLSPRTRIINTTRWQGKGKYNTRTIINWTIPRPTLCIITQLNMFKSDGPKYTCNKLSCYKCRQQSVYKMWQWTIECTPIHKFCRLRPKLSNLIICN